jgi:hypothetical protein
MAEWLKKLCLPEQKKDILKHPWLLESGGEVWTVATNGHVVVLLSGKVAGVPFAEGKTAESLAKFASPRGDAPPAGISLAALKEWLGLAVWELPCQECQGTSKGSQYVHCAFCDGDGVMSPDPRPGYLFGIPLDRNLLACALENLNGETATLRSASGNLDTEPFWLEATGWRLCAMPMATTGDLPEESGTWEQAPRFGEG